MLEQRVVVEDHQSAGAEDVLLGKHQLDHLPQLVTVVTGDALVPA